MKFFLQNHSSYPHAGDGPGQQRLQPAHAARERGDIEPAEAITIERSVIDEILHDSKIRMSWQARLKLC
ncbi:MAG: hypothetical protein ACHQ9S_11985 [Candidatus Binatia bacterium]